MSSEQGRPVELRDAFGNDAIETDRKPLFEWEPTRRCQQRAYRDRREAA
jgi:hypothetical protein